MTRRPAAGLLLGLSVYDCVRIATISAAFAVIAIINEPIVHVITAILGPYAGNALVGLFHVPGILAYRLVKKPWAAFVCQNLFGIVQVLLGNPSGFMTLWFTSFESVGQETALRLLPLSLRAGTTEIVAAGTASFVIALIPEYFIYGFGKLAWWAWLAPKIAVGIPSVLFFAFGLSAAARRVVAVPAAPELPPKSGEHKTHQA